MQFLPLPEWGHQTLFNINRDVDIYVPDINYLIYIYTSASIALKAIADVGKCLCIGYEQLKNY